MSHKERPILFSGPMVRAILAGHKTMTRRLVKPRHMYLDGDESGCGYEVDLDRCPYGKPGDRLWVRETWWQGCGPTWGDHCVVYDADKAIAWAPGSGFDTPDFKQFRKRPSIHMNRVYSRIDLEVVSRRDEHLQDITEADARAEGVTPYNGTWWDGSPVVGGKYDSPRQAFRALWESINGPESWDRNERVWVVSFKQIKE